jgi:VanZ family protein
VRNFLPAIFLAVAIIYLSVSPKISLPNEGALELSDKAAHFLAYFLLSFSLAWGYLRQNKKISRQKWSFIVVALVSFGIILEVVQYLIPDARQFSVFDILANSLGVLANKFVFKRFIA